MNNAILEETIAADETFTPEENLVMDTLHEISNLFKKASDVRDSHPTVQQLLCYSGHSSWEGFCEEFQEQVEDYFFEEEAKPQPKATDNAIESRRMRVAETIFQNSIKAKNSLAEIIKKMEEQITTMARAKQAAEIVILEHQFNSWDSEAQKKLAEAQKQVAIINSQLPQLGEKLKAEKAKCNRFNQEARYAEAKRKAAGRDGMIFINTGDMVMDAEIFCKIASDRAYKIASMYTAIARLRKTIDATNERYEAVESVHEVMYDSNLDRLTKLEIACDLLFEVYAHCEWGYEECVNSRELDATGYFPDFPQLWKTIRESQARQATYAVKRAQDQANTLIEMQKNGLL